MARTYKIRHSVAGTNQRKVYRLTVPPDLAEAIPNDQEFVPELTEDGILFRPVESAPEREVPAWAKRAK
jgi:hypothetical protein